LGDAQKGLTISDDNLKKALSTFDVVFKALFRRLVQESAFKQKNFLKREFWGSQHKGINGI